MIVVDLYQGVGGGTGGGYYIFCFFYEFLAFVLSCPLFFFVVARE